VDIHSEDSICLFARRLHMSEPIVHALTVTVIQSREKLQ
jgi:hypothetical protein